MTKTLVSNVSALACLTELENKNPKLVPTIEELRALGGNIVSIKNIAKYPEAFCSLLRLLGPRTNLIRYTLIHRTPNVCWVCGKTYNVACYARSYCSLRCSNSSEAKIQNSRTTYFMRTGFVHPMLNPEVIASMRRTALYKYGTSWHNNHEKAKLTLLKTRGVTNLSQDKDVQQKKIDNYRAKHGVDFPNQNPEVREKSATTNIEKYGVPHAMQDPTIFRKSCTNKYSIKKWVDEAGKVHKVQGYEPKVLDHLQEHYALSIVTDIMPSIPYGRLGKMYNPDLRYLSLTDKKILVEVKCRYTLVNQLSTNLEKFRAATRWCKDHGYIFTLAITEKGNSPVYYIPWPTPARIELFLSRFS